MTSAKTVKDPEKVTRLISLKIKKLTAKLAKSIASPTMTYSEISMIHSQGLYIIFDDKVVVYIGKTNRTGKVRMQELAADFRSHTFNRKLLSQRFKELGFVFEVLKKETKKEWIDKGIITMQDFKAHQKDVNLYIRQKLKFKFFKEEDARSLTALEHFAIAVFAPKYND